jgi:DNA-binding LacI/PurR family transcriptional regulator
LDCVNKLQLLSFPEQVAAHLREELLAGTWRSVMPGVHRLEAELGVHRQTVEAALRRLESERLLVPQGAGRRRLIRLPRRAKSRRGWRVAILLSETADIQWYVMVELQHELASAGHTVTIAPQTLDNLGMKVARIARLVRHTDADAWVVFAGSREVLEWFSAQRIPAFALFGRQQGLPIAGVAIDRTAAIRAATRALIELGHRRIVLLIDRRHRLPRPGPLPQAFLEALAARGIRTGSYNLPDWEPGAEGFQACLEKLFELTPPTALFIDEAKCFAAAQASLAQKRLRVPQDVSLVSTDDDPTFSWCEPSVAHIRFDLRPVIRHVVRWVARVSAGQRDTPQHMTPAKFVPGGTIGPVCPRQT